MVDSSLFMIQQIGVFFAGCCLGSFFNVLIYRLPAKQSIVLPGSHCTGCKHPIAFYDNIPLLSYLVLLKADSVILTGVSTSGCVRATVLDAFSNNFRIAVVEEGCFDRSQASHAINLCDMHAKYADVVKLDETLAFIDTLPKGMFELPQPL